MQGILASSRRPAVQPFGLASMSATLRQRELRFDLSVELTGLELISVTRRGDVLQAQVDPDRLPSSDPSYGGTLYGQAQVPIAHRVLREAA